MPHSASPAAPAPGARLGRPTPDDFHQSSSGNAYEPYIHEAFHDPAGSDPVRDCVTNELKGGAARELEGIGAAFKRHQARVRLAPRYRQETTQ